MRLEDLKKGDILVPNGATCSLYTQLADSLDFVCVAAKIYVVFGTVEAVVICTTDNAWLGQKIAFSSDDLACFDRCKLNAAELLRMKKKPRYLRWADDHKSLGRIGEETPLTDVYGNKLYVGDTVTVEFDYRCWLKRVVVKDDSFGYFVIGIKRCCDGKTGVIHKYVIRKDSSWTERWIGEQLPTEAAGIEITDKKPND